MNAHFIARCQERIPEEDPIAVYNDLHLASRRLSAGVDQEGDYIERIGRLPPGKQNQTCDLIRFRVASGIAFAVVRSNGTPVTVVSRSMIQSYKRKIRMVKRVKA